MKFIERSCLTRLEQEIEAGGWRSVYRQCGVSELCWTKQNQVCPLCGGQDRFSIFKKNGFTYCRHCGGRGTLKFVQELRHCSFVEAVEFAAEALGFVLDYQENWNANGKASNANWKTPSAEELWASGTPLDENCGSYRYLSSRGIKGPFPNSLRHCNELPYFEYSEEDKSWSRQNLSALLCQISKPGEETANVLRIYLEGDRKASVKTPKKVLKGSLAGGFVKLGDFDPEIGILGIAEGVETAMAASMLYGMPVWSVLSAPNLRNFEPPEGVREICIFADSDSNGAGQNAALVTATTLNGKYPDLMVSIRFPPGVDSDWNDVLNNRNQSDETGRVE